MRKDVMGESFYADSYRALRNKQRRKGGPGEHHNTHTISPKHQAHLLLLLLSLYDAAAFGFLISGWVFFSFVSFLFFYFYSFS